MRFEVPLGLLGLIGIPILIIIYIIKSKYTEQTIASTYLWELSERFLKRKKRISRLSGIIALILQILAVTIISLAIAHPIFTVPDAANSYCFILDGSGSMNMKTQNAELTRFEAGKDAIEEIIDDAVDGSRYTLIYVGNSTAIVFQNLEKKDQAKLLLEELEPVSQTANFSGALGVAQEMFNKDPSQKTYLVTDTAYETVDNLQLIHVGQSVENYGLEDVTGTHRGDVLTVSGKVFSYENSATVTVGLYLDGGTDPVATQDVSCGSDGGRFSLEATAETYASATVKILQEDALAEDNTFVIYNVESESSYDTLIVSESPFFVQSVLRSLIDAKIDVVAPSEYNDSMRGYGLYVFDTMNASTVGTLPSDGTVWLMNINGSLEGAGYTMQGEMNLEKAGLLTPTNSTASTAQSLVKDLRNEQVYVTRYVKCGFYRNFTTVYSYMGNPVVFVGTNDSGNREVVFGMNLRDSNLPLLHDYVVLMRNLVEYSFPSMVDETSFECGKEAVINMIANCDSVRVETPSGGVSYLNSNLAYDTVLLNEVGTYTVDMTVAGTARRFHIWSAIGVEERIPTQNQTQIGLQGENQSGGFDGEYDPLTVMFILLAVIFLADWMVYCYEKYQLR